MDKKAESLPVPQNKKPVAIYQLDVIRVVAVLAIFLHHLWKTVIPVPQDAVQSLLNIVFSAASDGVIVFNIISGFLLVLPYFLEEGRPPSDYRSFMRKRFLRVIPPYYLALLIFTLANILYFGFPLIPALDVLLQHLLFINSLNYSNMDLNLSPYWYLGLLAQFYLLFPFLVRFFLKVGAAKAALWIIGSCWTLWVMTALILPPGDSSYPSAIENLMHFNLPGRLPEFAIGMWLASLRGLRPFSLSAWRDFIGNPFSWFTATMAVYILLGAPFCPGMNLPLVHIYHVALSLIFFVLLFFWSGAATAGQLAFVKRLSEQSYAIFIVHHPLFSYVGVMPSKVTHSIGNFLLLTAMLLPVSYLAARLLNLLVAEITQWTKPFRIGYFRGR